MNQQSNFLRGVFVKIYLQATEWLYGPLAWAYDAAAWLVKGLKEAGHVTDLAADGEEGLALARERGWRTLLVVTAEHHSRRAWLTFRKAYRGSGVDVVLIAARGEWYDPGSWWQEERTFLAVWEEYLKLAYYLARGYLV